MWATSGYLYKDACPGLSVYILLMAGKSEDWHYTCKPHVDVGRNTSLGIYTPLQTVIQERNKLCLLYESNKS